MKREQLLTSKVQCNSASSQGFSAASVPLALPWKAQNLHHQAELGTSQRWHPEGKTPSGVPGSGLPALPSPISRLKKISMEQQSLQKAEGGGWRGRAVPQGPDSV